MIGAEVIYLMDLNGRTVASSNWNEKNSFIGQNFRYRPYFMDAVSGVDGRFYGVGTVSRTPGYFMSSPVFSRAGIAGVIAMKINLSRIDKEWQTDRNYDVTVADEYGIIFLSSKPDWKYRPSRRLTKEEQNTLKLTRKYDRLERSPMQISDQSIAFGPNAIREVTTVDVHGDVEKTRYVVIRKKFAETDWTVSIFIQADQVRALALRNTLVTFCALAFLSLAGLYWREQRKRIILQSESRRAIEAAHSELAQRHQQLEVLSVELKRKAITDASLGCYNRRFFMEQIGRVISDAKRHDVAMSIAIIDIDFFKYVNDTYGHLTGDRVLQRLVDICTAALRDGDLFARFGGEEFILALNHATSDEALLAAERLRETVSGTSLTHEDVQFSITISCGVAQYDPRDEGIEIAIQHADEALYAAKRSGRNRVMVSPLTSR